MSSGTVNSTVYLEQGGNALRVDGTAGGVIDTPSTNGKLPLGATNANTVQLGPVSNTIPTAVAPTNGSTITPPTKGGFTLLLNPAADTTGNIVAAGTYDGQLLALVNETAHSVTMAASGTSNVADGVSCVIAANTAKLLIWSAAASLWFHVA